MFVLIVMGFGKWA